MGEVVEPKLTKKQTQAAAQLKPALPTAQMSYALIQYTDMPSEMSQEVLEILIVACEKFSNNFEEAAKMIKDEMELKFHGNWHVVVGEAYGFEVSHELKKILYTFFGGTLGILIWCL